MNDSSSLQMREDLFIGVVGESQDAVGAFFREGNSANTVNSYRAALNYWAAWYALRYGRRMTLPLDVPAVVDFVTDHLEHSTAQGLRHNLPPAIDELLVAHGAKQRPGPLKLATVRHRLAVISEAHEVKELFNPCRSRTVQTLMTKVRTAYARRNVAVDRKQALTKDLMGQILGTCDGSMIGVRDRALLLFAWASGGRRRSEVVAATRENTRPVPEGFIFTLSQSKTNQVGKERADDAKPIVGRAAQALQEWIDRAEIASGPLFLRVLRGGHTGGPLAAGAIREIVINRARAAGLDGNFSAHSLRSGFVTEAGIQGRPIGEIMAMTGHSSVASVVSYHRRGTITNSPTSRLFDNDRE